MTDLPNTLEAAVAAVASRAVSAVELATASVEAFERANPAMNWATRIEREAAIARARAVDEALARGEPAGRLAGAPVAHKDIFQRDGAPVSCGSKIGWFAYPGMGPLPAVAPAVARLRAEGAVEVAALNMAEFAIGPTGHNGSFGNIGNPRAPGRFVGGSSGGSGATVAAGVVLGSLGTDTGGSIRQPAHFCGVVGLKPTHGLIPTEGAFPCAPSLDTVGPLARTVRDAALLTEVAAGTGEILPGIEDGVRGLRIGVPTGRFVEGVEPRIQALVEQARALLEQAGATLVPVSFDGIEPIEQAGAVVGSAEMGLVHREMMAARADDYPPMVRVRLENALRVPEETLRDALAARDELSSAFAARTFAGCDLLLIPSVAISALRYDEADISTPEKILALVAACTRLNRPFNYLGLPSLAVPMAVGEGELSAAFQLIGPKFSEPVLFRTGRAYERAVS